MTKRKDNAYPKRPPKKNRLQQLQTHNVPTDDVKNTNGTSQDIGMEFAIEKCVMLIFKKWKTT